MLAPLRETGLGEAGVPLVEFLAGIASRGETPDAADVFHAVRQLPYLSDGDRSLLAVLKRRAGSCSGKHILLAAALRQIGIPAEVELVLGDFATPFRQTRGVPAALTSAATDGIRDIHNIVRAELPTGAVLLDATWNDAMLPFGLRVNDRWVGEGDTVIAVDVQDMLGPADDPARAKQEIIGTWPPEEQLRRRRFLEAVNIWVADVARHPAT